MGRGTVRVQVQRAVQLARFADLQIGTELVRRLPGGREQRATCSGTLLYGSLQVSITYRGRGRTRHENRSAEATGKALLAYGDGTSGWVTAGEFNAGGWQLR